MKKKLLICAISVLAALALIAIVVYLSGRTVPGSEETVEGVVVDLAMGKVREEDFRARSYITLEFEDGTARQFWFSRPLQGHETGARLGDTVRMETATEAATGLSVVTGVAVLEE